MTTAGTRGRKVAFLFPGQGSQQVGMGKALHDAFPECRAVFDEADRALGQRFSELVFEGPEAELGLTENTQPALLATSTAAAAALHARGVRPAIVAGHSLGEYSALVEAGSLGFAEAIELVRKRGRYMQEAVPVGQGAMAALVGLDEKAVGDLCAEAARGEVVVGANFNTPEQTVVAGHADAVRRAVALAEARGVKRAVMLAVSAPFHSPLMVPAGERLARDLAATPFAEPSVPVVTNVDARLVAAAAEAREALVRQVASPVQWTATVQRLVAEGVTTVIEVGPGRVLLGLVRRIDRSLELLNVEDPASLEKTVAALGSPRS